MLNRYGKTTKGKLAFREHPNTKGDPITRLDKDTIVYLLCAELNDAQQVLFRLQRIADTLPADARLALRRRVHQLTMDYIYNVIRDTRSRRYLNRKLDELSALGIYPLPKRDYTQKYKWFRRLANSNMGLSVLLAAIPILSKEQ